ncbi:EF-hand [Serendipita vermifera]|nr:EF-hand [Serendipita vermifera]
MGVNNSKLSKVQVNELMGLTKFTSKEIKKWHEDFIKQYPEGQISKEGLSELFCRSGNSEELANFIFALFDQNENGTIEFREFIITISMISPRREDPNGLKISFDLFDLDHNNRITKREMLKVVRAIYKACAYVDQPLRAEVDTPESRVEEIFNRMDHNKDNQLTLLEFQDGCRDDPTIQAAVSWFSKVIEPAEGTENASNDEEK